ncbi:MAG: hypothetical protein US50_C0007G0005 [Candidatus Nomurabacteria bacterium GW2011_GWB1_37_5]|uniref:Uncharacterized protein n=1 Tax=Candidatus Nomurabacteria bacterium GW2011_GWB1_37_5 TaxID=1618742 RepID=A0A0G0H0K4_9BACT|nr:MAG: hypothetical protein US50_C0007G0005 [Candidatus Nomurabacteria bacterium GW2011_GWB1_37_5]
MNNHNPIKYKIIFGVVLVSVLAMFFYFAPFSSKSELKKAEAFDFSILKFFGGKIEKAEYNTGCEDMTEEILTATYGSVYLTVDKIEIGKPKPATVGILRLWEVAIVPPVVRVLGAGFYRHVLDTFPIENTWALGAGFDITSSISSNGFSAEGKDSDGNATTYNLASFMSSGSCSLLANLIYFIGAGRPTSL